MAIENFISVHAHRRARNSPRRWSSTSSDYDVDIMNLQRAEALVPARAGGLIEVKLANGATLKRKTRGACHRRPLAHR